MKRVLLLGILLLATLPLSSAEVYQQTVEQRLDRIERRLDLLFRHLGLPIDDQPTVIDRPPSVHLQFGLPTGSGRLLDKEFFVMSHRSDLRIPEWVAYNLTEQNIQGTAARTDDFRPDPELRENERSELSDYRNSGFDRGHMAPAASFKRSRIAMSATFLLSNMTPQTPNLNRRIWAQLEDDERSLARAHGNIWIFTGSLFLDANGSPAVPARFIGTNRVAVPTHLYKAILCRHSPDTFEMFAFIMPNQRQPLPGTPRNYLVSVDRIEQASRLDLFAALPDDTENRIEATTATHWPIP